MNRIKNIVWLAICMTGLQLSALPLPRFWKSRVQENVQKVVARETPKLVTSIKNVAMAAASAVGQKTLNTLGSTAQLTAQCAWNHPKIAAGLVAGGYLYYKKDDIGQWCQEKYQQYKPYVWGAAGIVAVAGAAVAAKKMADNFEAVQSLIQSLPKYAAQNSVSNAAEAASSVSHEEFTHVANDIWNEIEAGQNISMPIHQESFAHIPVDMPAVPLSVAADVSSAPIEQVFEHAWHESFIEPVMSQVSMPASGDDASFSLPMTQSEKSEATDLLANFKQEFKPRTHMPPEWNSDRMRALLDQQSVEQRHPWIAEFEKQKHHSVAQQWADEFEQKYAEKCTNSDSETESIASVGSIEDFKRNATLPEQPQVCGNANAISRINRFLEHLFPSRVCSE